MPRHVQAQDYELTAPQDADRIDRFVASALADLSRSAVQRLIDQGAVQLNDEIVLKASHNVHAGDQVHIHVPPPQPTHLVPQDIPLSILYEDDAVIVINKAAGMVVHPGAGNPSGTMVNAILAHCPDLQGVGGELRPGIVHRLDKQTSGVIIVAKHDQAIRKLQRQFRRRTVRKRYVALLIGTLEQPDGVIEAPIGRHPVHRKRMAVLGNGKPARTRWHVMSRYRDVQGHGYTLIDVHLHTGRTHQIRVHFSWLGYPLVGDRIYGPRRAQLKAPRQCLHARHLTIQHPTTDEVLTFSAPLPPDFEAVLARLTPDTKA